MEKSELAALLRRVAVDRVERDRLYRVASGYREDPHLEALLRLREDDPAEFKALMTPQRRISLGYYQTEKTAHDVVAELEGRGQ